MFQTSPKSSPALGLALFGAVLALTPAAAVPAQAQSEMNLTDSQREEIQSRLDSAAERLGLTDQQREQVLPILRANTEANLRILQRYGFSRGNRPDLSLRQKLSLRREFSAQRDETNERLSRVLSRDQMRIMDEIQDENREQMRERIQG
jgi:hypothetical protein